MYVASCNVGNNTPCIIWQKKYKYMKKMENCKKGQISNIKLLECLIIILLWVIIIIIVNYFIIIIITRLSYHLVY